MSLSTWPVFVGDACSRRAVCGLGCSGSRSETVLKRLDPALFPRSLLVFPRGGGFLTYRGSQTLLLLLARRPFHLEARLVRGTMKLMESRSTQNCPAKEQFHCFDLHSQISLLIHFSRHWTLKQFSKLLQCRHRGLVYGEVPSNLHSVVPIHQYFYTIRKREMSLKAVTGTYFRVSGVRVAGRPKTHASLLGSSTSMVRYQSTFWISILQK